MVVCLALRGNDVVKILPVLLGVWIRESIDVIIRMGGSSVVFETMGSQESRIIMSTMSLVPPSKPTE